MPKQTNKIGLTRSAVIQRINRKLSANNERLRVTRNDERMLREVGQFYITGEEGVNRRMSVPTHSDQPFRLIPISGSD